jgi:anti-anti-sigma factor
MIRTALINGTRMEITLRQSNNVLELHITGRLDAYWANHLASRLDEVIREGAHRLRLNMAAVEYLSSAGIGVLVQYYGKLKEIHGSFAVTNPSRPVQVVLGMAKLDALLVADIRPPSALLPTLFPLRRFERAQTKFEVFEYVADATLKCRTVGAPELLDGCRFGAEHCQQMAFPTSTFAVGLGAFGHEFADCRNRFGEFLAVAGGVAYLPTDGTNVPDYLVAAENFVPEVQMLYGLVAEGAFAYLARFEANKEAGAVGLTELIDTCLEIASAETAGVVMVAETAGLIGAALRRSPTSPTSTGNGKPEPIPLAYPQIREWLSFTAERAHARSLALVAGVAARGESAALSPFIRPLGRETRPAGHFHAAAFSYRPLKKGEINLQKTVATLFEGATLHDVLHLLNDGREFSGAGESEFVRGACWISPVTEVATEGGKA